MKISTMALISALLALPGCSSDIDKCVDAQVASDRKNPSYKDQSIEDIRAGAYLLCLSVQAKK
jgi:hypothetical protein